MYTQQPVKQTLYSVQFLRAIAVILVLLSHIRHKQEVAVLSGFQWLEWFNFGEYGVDIFFVISGFIIAYIAPKAQQTGVDVLHFMIKRLIRIMPLYYTVTLVALWAWWLNPALVNSSAPQSTVILPSFFLFPTEGRFLVQSGWTLSYEMYFYALFALALLAGRLQYHILSLFLGLSLLVGVAFNIPNPALALMTSPHLAEFLAGFLFYHHGSKYIGQHKTVGLVLIAVGITLCVSQAFSDNTIVAALNLWGIPAMALIFGFLLSEGHIKFPAIFLKIGDSSYSTYLTHILALPVLTKLWYLAMPQSSISHLVFIIFALGLTLLIGAITFKLYEKPVGLRLNRWWHDIYHNFKIETLDFKKLNLEKTGANSV